MDGFAQVLMQVLSTPKSPQQLLEKINIPERTLRYNLSILKKQNLISEISVFTDMRRKLFLAKNKGCEQNEKE